jgi:hypothetical protein
MLHRAWLATLVVSIPILGCTQAEAPAPAQEESTAPSIEGVWRITEIVTTGANAATNTSPQPSLVIFTRGHYSYLSVNGTAPRPEFAAAKDPANLTDAEKIARFEQWGPFTAQSGTYEVNGTTITRRPIVAKNVTVMTTNPPVVQEFMLDGDKLVLITKSAAGQPVSETRTTLTRVA